MILGAFAGKALKEDNLPAQKLKFFITTGLGLIVFAMVLHFAGINPIVKRIWTPAWTIFSGGICFLFLAFFYWVIDVLQKKKWSFFLTVIGMNSIAAYFIADGGVRSFIADNLYIHLGHTYDQLFGVAYATIVKGLLVLLFIWLILYWMYKKKIFIKI